MDSDNCYINLNASNIWNPFTSWCNSSVYTGWKWFSATIAPRYDTLGLFQFKNVISGKWTMENLKRKYYLGEEANFQVEFMNLKVVASDTYRSKWDYHIVRCWKLNLYYYKQSMGHLNRLRYEMNTLNTFHFWLDHMMQTEFTKTSIFSSFLVPSTNHTVCDTVI